jgi:hypothetical protein
VKRASNDTIAGRRYLELQRQAKRTGRPTDELIQLYALECFLDRLVHSKFADTFVLKSGVLLAALDARRPTRDIDFAVGAIENTTEKVLSAVQTIAAISLEDGMEFDSNCATAATIREEDSYSGIRVTLGGTLSRAVIRFHVDVNVADPIWPGPQQISVPRLIEGVIVVRGYPLEMVLTKHSASIKDFKTLTARYSGDGFNRRVVVTVRDRVGRCYVDEYVGMPARHIKVTDHLGRVRTKRGGVRRLQEVSQ